VRVLVDSCVWSLLLRRKARASLNGDEQFKLASLKEAIRDGRVAILGPIRQEVLSGIKAAVQFEKLRAALATFPDEPLTARQYEEAARLFNLCRSRGFECGSIDILICAVAVEMGWDILTSDQGLTRCIRVLRAEGLLR
jgi:predicted nucleic acid-binding protein